MNVLYYYENSPLVFKSGEFSPYRWGFIPTTVGHYPHCSGENYVQKLFYKLFRHGSHKSRARIVCYYKELFILP